MSPAKRWCVDRWLIAFILLLAIGVARIVSTYHVFSQTFDEPSNLACGMEWLAKGTYSYDVKHPPLGRVAVALFPYLSGLRSIGFPNPYVEGNALLLSDGAYERHLTLARLGTLPFFVLSSVVVWLWTATLFGRPAAVAAALLYTTLPPILGHSAEARADMALAMALPAALYAFCLWLERATLVRALWLGVTVACAILSKLTALVFLPACFLILWVSRWRGIVPHAEWKSSGVSNWVTGLITASVLSLFLVWGGYRFSWGPISTLHGSHPSLEAMAGDAGRAHAVLNAVLETPLPAPELARGVYGLWSHSREKRPSFFLGRMSLNGWWYYLPVILVIKTPLPFLILAGLGIFTLTRRAVSGFQDPHEWTRTALLLSGAMILLVGLLGRVHIALRHILAIYPILAIIAGYAALSMLRSSSGRKVARYVCAGLICWHLLSSAAAHPDYLPYFNEIVGNHPENFSVNELDFGQDLKRLSELLGQLNASSVAIAYYGTANLSIYPLPAPRPLQPYRRASGWVAISVRRLQMGACPRNRIANVDAYSWLNAYHPVALAGKSIRVYFLPDEP